MAKPRTQHVRPSVDLGTSDIKREWQTVEFRSLKVGDLVPDRGVVLEVDHSFEGRITHTFPSSVVTTSTEERFSALVFAFTAVR